MVNILASIKNLQSWAKEAPGWFWTILSMIVSIWAYSWLFGWILATGIIVILFIHELGHILMALILRIRIGYPIFYPGVGAIIDLHQITPGPTDNALLGITGPIFGTIASAGCWVVYSLTGIHYWAELACFGMLPNLFNLLPLGEMDGGRIAGVLSRWLALPGYLILAALAWFVRTPILWLSLVIMLPAVLEIFSKKRRLSTANSYVSRSDRAILGSTYLLLVGFLTFGVWHLFTTAVLPGFKDGRNHVFPHRQKHLAGGVKSPT
jgi:Zn-dependent protease